MADNTPNIYLCQFTDTPIKLTGHLDDPAWKYAKTLDFFVPITYETPISKTDAKILWDKNLSISDLKHMTKIYGAILPKEMTQHARKTHWNSFLRRILPKTHTTTLK